MYEISDFNGSEDSSIIRHRVTHARKPQHEDSMPQKP
jgi:hypothetical protein